MIHVLLVDDQPLIRAGLRGILAAQPGIDVTDVGDGYTGADHARDNHVDVVLMDIRMPGIDGVETTRRIRAAQGAHIPRILILTTFENDETVIDALRAGADGFLSKGIEPAELVAAVRALASGVAPLSAKAREALIRHAASPERPRSVDATLAALFETLTSREREIVRAIATGRTHEAVADEEHISRYTVKTHINRAMMKVGASDRAQLVAFAHRAGLVDS